MQLDRAPEVEAVRLLKRDVEESQLLELLRSVERAHIDRAEAAVGDELRDLLLRLVVVPRESTSGCSPSTLPSTSVLAKVVLKALTTGAPRGTSCATSAADELPGSVARRSHVWVSTGFVMSTTT
jgi:hypothetical protein